MPCRGWPYLRGSGECFAPVRGRVFVTPRSSPIQGASGARKTVRSRPSPPSQAGEKTRDRQPQMTGPQGRAPNPRLEAPIAARGAAARRSTTLPHPVGTLKGSGPGRLQAHSGPRRRPTETVTGGLQTKPTSTQWAGTGRLDTGKGYALHPLGAARLGLTPGRQPMLGNHAGLTIQTL
jgi:hypothetical protein